MQSPKHLLIQKKGRKEAWKTDGTNGGGGEARYKIAKRNI